MVKINIFQPMRREFVKAFLSLQSQILPLEKRLRTDKLYKSVLILAWSIGIIFKQSNLKPSLFHLK
jgi:hypothetical protein